MHPLLPYNNGHSSPPNYRCPVALDLNSFVFFFQVTYFHSFVGEQICVKKKQCLLILKLLLNEIIDDLLMQLLLVFFFNIRIYINSFTKY